MPTAGPVSRDNSTDKPAAAASGASDASSLDMATASSSSAGHVEIETIESVDEDIDPETPDEDCASNMATSSTARKPTENEEPPTSGEESELDPLQCSMSKAVDGDKDTGSQNACLEMGDEDGWSKDFDRDSQSPTARKKGWDVRCFVIGVLVLLLVVGGASVIVLAHRLKGETTYGFHFASYYADHMVLQRAPHRAVIWGFGPILSDNTTVLVVVESSVVTYEQRTVVVKTNAGSIWRVMVGPVVHPGPFTITATLEGLEGYSVTIQDVLFGDIWVCVEQNKIHLSVNKLLNGSDEEHVSANPFQDIRLFSLSPAKSDMPWYDLRGIQLQWTVPKSVVSDRMSRSHANLHFPGICWLFGKQLHERLRYPIGLISVTYSESLTEEWVPYSVIENCYITFTDSSSRIWNGMIHPMLDMQVFGLLWHQGETDAIRDMRNYDCALVEFIRLWRQEVYSRAGGSSHHSLPVGIVQLPPKPISVAATPGYSRIRWEQTAKYGYLPNHLMPSTFLAVTIDLPEGNPNYTSYHGVHKHDIVSRLVHGAMSVAYHKGHSRQEPFPKSYSARRGSLVLNFDPPRITIRNRDGFEICCSKNRTTEPCPTNIDDIERKQIWLPAQIADPLSSTSVTLSSAGCNDHIVAFRYAWRETPCPLKSCAIYSGDSNFPMPPYIRFNLTDDGVTRTFDGAPVDIL